jgi:hypothetical protein
MRTTSRLALCAARGACAVCTGFVQTSNSAVCTVQKAVDVCDFTYSMTYSLVRTKSKIEVGSSSAAKLTGPARLYTPCWG